MSDQEFKICWSCGGEVSKQSLQCPFCGAHLGESTANSSAEGFQKVSPVSSSLPPTSEAAGFKPLYAASDFPEEGLSPESQPQASVSSSAMNKEVLAFGFLLTAVGLFLFALILFLFSKNGYLVLKWKASYWILCLALSIPTFMFGWKYLNQVEEANA